MRKALSLVLLMFVAGCSLGPIEDYDSFNFLKPPEIWERNGEYYLRVYEADPAPGGTSPPGVEVRGDQVHVYIWGRHSNGSNPRRLYNLDLKATTPPLRFFWINPNGTRVPMEILKR